MQSALEKELDRRSSDWSFKLEKYQLEEQRLCERVRELVEHNVSLQREVSSFSKREIESKSVMAFTDQQLKGLTDKTEIMKNEIIDLQQNLLSMSGFTHDSPQISIIFNRILSILHNFILDLRKSLLIFLQTLTTLFQLWLQLPILL